HDRVRHAIERDAATDYIRVAAHALLPEILSYHRDIGGLFLPRRKIAAANRSHPENIEIVRRHFTAEKLNGIAQSGQSKWNSVFAAETVENRLAIPVMLKTWQRDGELQQVTLPGVGIHV